MTFVRGGYWHRELADDALMPVSYAGEGPGGSTFCVNMAAIIRRKRLLVGHSCCIYLMLHCCASSTVYCMRCQHWQLAVADMMNTTHAAR